MAILAGLSPAASANSNSAVNTSASSTRRDSQSLEANSNVTTAAETNSANAAASCQRSLPLSYLVTGSETLESPAYVPSDFSVLPNDVTAAQISEEIGSGVQQAVADVESKNGAHTSNDACQSPSAVASISIETETPAVMSNAPAYEKLMPAQPVTAKTSKFAAVKRRFTVSKTVLPSSAAPPVVVFSKLSAETENPCEVQNVDDVGRVHIVDKSQSINVTAVNKSSPVCEADSSPSSVDVCATTEAVAAVLTASDSALESTVIMTDELCADEIGSDEKDVSLSQDTCECDPQLVASTGSQLCGENVDSLVSESQCDGNADENAEMLVCGLQQSDITVAICAASECADLETSTESCDSDYRVNCEKDSLCKFAAELHEANATGDQHGIVPASALQESCPVAVSCAGSECGSELQCTTDELPFSAASDDILQSQVTDSVTSCSTVRQVTAPVPSALPSSLLCNKHNVQCDSNPQIAESMPSATATQFSSHVQDETDDKH